MFYNINENDGLLKKNTLDIDENNLNYLLCPIEKKHLIDTLIK